MPENEALTETGISNFANARLTASVAWDKDAPSAKLKLKESEGTPPSWLTPKAVLVSWTWAMLESGMRWPLLF